MPTQRLLDALAHFVSDQQQADALLHAREAVYAVFREAGYPMVSVALPARIGTDGIVHLRVRETTIGRVTITGNKHYADGHFRAMLPSLQEGRSPNLGTLASELFVANDHSGYRVTLAFKPGAEGHADVEIQVLDASPKHAVFSVDNSGTSSTGHGRATAMFSDANLWGRAHEAVLGYTTSLHPPSKVQQLFISYQWPLGSFASRLVASASYSNTDAGRVAEVFEVAGQGSAISLRLQRDLLRSDSARQFTELGIEDKRSRNTVDFFGTNLGVGVNARPMTLGYTASARTRGTSVLASIGYTRNIPGGSRNDDAAYDASRAGASAGWHLWRARVQADSAIAGGWTWSGRLDAQYTRQPLVSSEQFGLGGARSVRGFEEREASGDRGWRGSIEVRTPVIARQHHALAFVDAGGYERLNALAGEAAGASLLSYGIGWRWALDASLAASLDVARVVRGTQLRPAGSHALHFSASWRPI
ncbi:MAG: ShlB/FhaC/HecB family hemolysin secretion/activation protein [Burkholderiales bacterium]|nr:ShlB/FhaC/HecB family hemolysin secretion/activation protein [Burkholderiales bacterium]